MTYPPDNLPPTETDIHAYADGVLAAERSERLRHYLGNQSDEARRVVFYSGLNERLKRAFQPADEPVTPRAIRAQGRRTAPKRLLTPNACGVALRTFIALAFAFVALSGWIVALQASDEALSDAAVMALARAPRRYHDATPPAQVAGPLPTSRRHAYGSQRKGPSHSVRSREYPNSSMSTPPVNLSCC